MSLAKKKKKILKELMKKMKSLKTLNIKMQKLNTERGSNSMYFEPGVSDYLSDKMTVFEKQYNVLTKKVDLLDRALFKLDPVAGQEIKKISEAHMNTISKIKEEFSVKKESLTKETLSNIKEHSNKKISLLASAFFDDLTPNILTCMNNLSVNNEDLDKLASQYFSQEKNGNADINPALFFNKYTKRTDNFEPKDFTSNILSLFLTLKFSIKDLFIEQDLKLLKTVRNKDNQNLCNDFIMLKTILSDIGVAKRLISDRKILANIDNATKGIEIILSNVIKLISLGNERGLGVNNIDINFRLIELIKSIFNEGHPQFALSIMSLLNIHSYKASDLKTIVDCFKKSPLSSNEEINKYLLSGDFEININQSVNTDEEIICCLIIFIEQSSVNLMDTFVKKLFNEYILNKSLKKDANLSHLVSKGF